MNIKQFNEAIPKICFVYVWKNGNATWHIVYEHSQRITTVIEESSDLDSGLLHDLRFHLE